MERPLARSTESDLAKGLGPNCAEYKKTPISSKGSNSRPRSQIIQDVPQALSPHHPSLLVDIRPGYVQSNHPNHLWLENLQPLICPPYSSLDERAHKNQTQLFRRLHSQRQGLWVCRAREVGRRGIPRRGVGRCVSRRVCAV